MGKVTTSSTAISLVIDMIVSSWLVYCRLSSQPLYWFGNMGFHAHKKSKKARIIGKEKGLFAILHPTKKKKMNIRILRIFLVIKVPIVYFAFR